MSIPGIIRGFGRQRVKGGEELQYCQRVNGKIKSLARDAGRTERPSYYSPLLHVYQTEDIKCTYHMSDSGREFYVLEIGRDIADDIPEDFAVFDEGYCLVYESTEDDDEVFLTSHVPGSWVYYLDKL